MTLETQCYEESGTKGVRTLTCLFAVRLTQRGLRFYGNNSRMNGQFVISLDFELLCGVLNEALHGGIHYLKEDSKNEE